MDKEEWQNEYIAHVDAFNEFRFKCQNMENYETIKSLLGSAVEYLYRSGNEKGYLPQGVEDND
jgi:hypothetical protein